MAQEYFVFKTSFAQERLWFLQQFAPGNPYYHIHIALPLGVDADVKAVARCLRGIVRRHEALRTTFVVVKGQPVQAVSPSLDLPVPVVDLGGCPAAESAREFAALSEDESQRPFDLTKGPLLRTTIVRLDGGETILLLTMHHIVSDGWSIDVLTRELWVLYEAFAAGQPSPLQDLPIQYADFTAWQRDYLQGEVLDRQLAYWRKQLESAPAVLELPADRQRPAVQSYAGAYQSASLPVHLLKQLRREAYQQGATMFMTLATAFSTLLHRYSGQDDIVLGTPIAGRNRPEVQDLIGFFVNTLVLRLSMEGRPSFRELLRRMREVALEAYQHQDLPFEKLVAELAPERHLGHSPIFQVMFVHQTSLEDRQTMTDRRGRETAAPKGLIERGTAKFDLTLFTRETDAGDLAVVIEYNTDLFDDRRMTRLLGHFETLVESLVTRPDEEVATLPLLTRAELEQLSEWSGRRTTYPRDACVHELVAAQAAARPNAAAVVCAERTLTYAELVEEAARIAHRLRSLGAGPDVPVAVCLDRSPELIVSLLGVLGAGAAYVPLDPGYPSSRLRFMLDDTNGPIVLTTTDLANRLPAVSRTLRLDTPEERDLLAALPTQMPSTAVTAENLAYVMYTSGSTGVPKGVAVPHRGVVRLVAGTDYVTLGPQETLLQFAPVSFDASTFEIWGALANGGRLVVAPPGLRAVDTLGAMVQRHGVTTLWLTASVFQEVLEGDVSAYRGLRQLLAGGDVLSPPHVRRARDELPGCLVINGYGPTEGTTFTCCHAISETDGRTTIPIGQPISNSLVRVLDARLQPVAIGVAGELFIGGDGLARGYWHRDEATAERFIADPWSRSSGRLYRTGDLARYREDGLLEFLGRRDHQTKVRGFRVELGEVEAALLRQPGVRAAAVLPRDEGSARRLVAYIASESPEDLTVATVRRALLDELPDYMVPSAFVIVDRLPLTPSGKIDRRGLGQVSNTSVARDAAYAAPATAIEGQILKVWQEVLGVADVGTNDNFFELGGHSLLMVRAQRMLLDSLRISLTLVELFQYPTISSLAEHLGTRTRERATRTPVEERAKRQRQAMRQHRDTRTADRRENPA